MSDLTLITTTCLLIAFAIGLIRALQGPGIGDRLLSLLLIGTTGVALLLVIYGASGNIGLLDTALALAILAPVTTVAFLVTTASINTVNKENKINVD